LILVSRDARTRPRQASTWAATRRRRGAARGTVQGRAPATDTARDRVTDTSRRPADMTVMSPVEAVRATAATTATTDVPRAIVTIADINVSTALDRAATTDTAKYYWNNSDTFLFFKIEKHSIHSSFPDTLPPTKQLRSYNTSPPEKHTRLELVRLQIRTKLVGHAVLVPSKPFRLTPHMFCSSRHVYQLLSTPELPMVTFCVA
jgi:hypothetical protein